MTFYLRIPTEDPPPESISLGAGQVLFILGANGTGKSSLMMHFAAQYGGRVKRISAHRQTWMNNDKPDMTPSDKQQTQQRILSKDHGIASRYRDDFGPQRISIIIYELIDAENDRARRIANKHDSGDINGAQEEAKTEAPITTINKLLRQSNLPIEISIGQNQQLLASKPDGKKYSVAQLSDGERNALLIASEVLTAQSETLLVIDEPERHLHRSIISPLLGQLFQARPDCTYVISTHDHGLPLEFPNARTLLLRSCTFDDERAQHWEIDELPADAPLDDSIRQDLLGARQRILFVEGTSKSLDKAIYGLMFPMASVIPKGSCDNVEQAVAGVRGAGGLHWLQVYGVVDGDGYEADQVENKQGQGVYVLPFYSVEAIYFHPRIIAQVAKRRQDLQGDDPVALERDAIANAITAIKDQTERLSIKAAKKEVRRRLIQQIPNDDELMTGDTISLQNDATSILERRKSLLDTAIKNRDWEMVLVQCPIRESGALAAIWKALRFPSKHDYQKAVLKLLADDIDTLSFVRGLFGDLYAKLDD